MTIDEFLDRLKNVYKVWRLTPTIMLRHRPIRCDSDTCPVVAVAGLQGSGIFQIQKAQKVLELNSDDLRDLMEAADGAPGPLRRRMLEACHLPLASK